MAKNPSKVAALRAMREANVEAREHHGRTGTELALVPTVDAPLPERYQAAQKALAECHKIDECKDWASKAEALASYARQMDDDTLLNFAKRIQARAIRRAGELLKEFQSPGARTDQPTVDIGPRSQRQAAEAAGLSERQEKTAVRVANVPDTDFESAVESDVPLSVTKLAAMGKRDAPPGFKLATHILGEVKDFADFCEKNPPEAVASGVEEYDGKENVRARVTVIVRWLKQFSSLLEA